MKEDGQARYFRWGIPGWMMFISFFGYAFIDIVFSQDSAKNKIWVHMSDIIQNGGTSSSMSAAFVGLLIAVTGIPLGFLIYQLYFYIRWNSPFSRDGLFPPLVVGRWKDLERSLQDISTEQLAENEPWRIKWLEDTNTTNDHSEKWRYVENYFTEIIQKLDMTTSVPSLHARYRYLLELLHTLGSGLFGLYLGYLGYLILKVKVNSFSLSLLVFICAVCLIFLIALLEAEDKLRKNHLDDMNQSGLPYKILASLVNKWPFIRHINISIIYLWFWGTFLYIGSPSLYPNTYSIENILTRLLILSFPLVGWFLSGNKPNDKLRSLELALLIVTSTAAYFSSQYMRIFLTEEHWPWGWATFSFLVANAVLIKNRQNTRDDLIAMQNFTFKRFFNRSPGKEVIAKPKKDKELKFRLRF